MQIRVGYEIIYECPQPTPMFLTLNVHSSRVSDLVIPDKITTSPVTPITAYHDGFGNWCSRLVAPPGDFQISTDALINDSGLPDIIDPSAPQHTVENLPDETLVFLLGSRYCETDLLSDTAWQLFERTPPGWSRVKAICDFVHEHITFSYDNARPSKTAFETFNERAGVCRDYAHLAVALCRCMNIPARYCMGYVPDIDVPKSKFMDFAAWFEAYLDGRWHIFDPRNNVPLIGRVLIARGRDATDVPISNVFGPNILKVFKVVADEVKESADAAGA